MNNNLMVTEKNVELFYNGKVYSVLKGEGKFKLISRLVKENPVKTQEDMDLLIDKVYKIISAVSEIKKDFKKFTKEFDMNIFPDFIQVKLKSYLENKFPIDSIVNLWKNIKENPSEQSKEHVFKYLNENNFMFTEDGCFIAYKKVTEEFRDCHTNRFDNSIGAVVSMPREQCDFNPNVDCSVGFHVANLGYARGFSGSRLLEVKVDPKDFTSIPTSASGKMRCCKYKVMREVTNMTDSQIIESCKKEIYYEPEKEVIVSQKPKKSSSSKKSKKKLVNKVVVRKVKKTTIKDKSQRMINQIERISKGRLFIPSKILKGIIEGYDTALISVKTNQLEITFGTFIADEIVYKGKKYERNDLPVDYLLKLDDNNSLRISKSILDKISDKNKFKVQIKENYLLVY